MSQRADFVAKARAEIGTKENPANSNKVKYNNNNGEPWCGYFVMWCAKSVGLNIPNVVYTPAGVSGFQGKGLWANAASYTPQPGDIFFCDFPGGEKIDHVGIVVKDNGDGTFVSCEGNTIPDGATGSGKIAAEANGGEVCMKVRAYRADNKRKLPVFVVGFGKPQFKD